MRARAANGIGHQPPKLAICGFESHRAFHFVLLSSNWKDARPITEKFKVRILAEAPKMFRFSITVMHSAVNRGDLSPTLRAGAKSRGQDVTGGIPAF